MINLEDGSKWLCVYALILIWFHSFSVVAADLWQYVAVDVQIPGNMQKHKVNENVCTLCQVHYYIFLVFISV